MRLIIVFIIDIQLWQRDKQVLEPLALAALLLRGKR